MRAFGALPTAGIAGGHSRFGRGRGNGTARRSTATLCTSLVSWVEAGLRKAAIGSLGGGLGTEAALGIEPVTSSLAGASLPPLVLFRISRRSRTPESPRLQFRAESGGLGLARAAQRDVALLSPTASVPAVKFFG